MTPYSFPGTYEDDNGIETITWHIQPSELPGWAGRYEIRTRIRGIDMWGSDFDGLEPDSDIALGRDALALNSAGEFARCVLTGDLPCTIAVAGERVATAVHWELDLRDDPDRSTGDPKNLQLSTVVEGTAYAITDDCFERGLLSLDAALRPHRLVCCVTCQYSDYSPLGNGLMGMRCHRDAKDQYLAVSSKAAYWSVPVTEDVPETYLCDEYQLRVAGTGYRG